MAAFYKNSIDAFLLDNAQEIIGQLTYQGGVAGFHQQLHKQTLSWAEEIQILKESLETTSDIDLNRSGILLEYPIARREKRIDVVLLIKSLVIVLEFKAGRESYQKADEEQLLDYCLDLRDFHFESRGKTIIPILLAPKAGHKPSLSLVQNFIHPIIYTNKQSLGSVINDICRAAPEGYIDSDKWNNSIYSPTPTIIEAAKTLFAGKSVEEISRSHAGTKNLTRTTDAVVNAIKMARQNGEKIICFITGVPGAGKTLAGLNIAHHSDFQNEDNSLATFLSGNGPLIKVLREALKRDAVARLKQVDPDTKAREQKRVIAFIENVHRFIDSYFSDPDQAPNNQIIIFDEAQRAWNAEHSNRKFQRPFSEPEMIFNIMDRHKDWSVIVALVGGGQEINTGEAGLREWGNNIIAKFPHWKIYVSPALKTGDHSTGNLTLFENDPENVMVVEDPDLHLDVAIRSYKAEELSRWVNLVLTNQVKEAEHVLRNSLQDYPIVITRYLAEAKEWLSAKCTGTRRMGLVASSGARRIRPYGLEVKAELEEENWFLNPRNDVRSSYYLEVPATEFGIQGLELDWVGVCWDADLRRTDNGWDFKSFKGTDWRKVSNEETRQYILNKYRVLLTRAREGMVIWIPEGNKEDYTRTPKFYDPIYEYLIACGVKKL